MHVQSLINPDIPTLHKTDTCGEALRIMNEFHVSELPLVADNAFVLLIKEEALLEADADATVASLIPQAAPSPVVSLGAHPYEAAVRMAEFRLSLLPVVDEEAHYQGVVTRRDLFTSFFTRTWLSEPGGIVVLEMKPMNYSLSEIAGICESCDATVLNTQVFSQPDQEEWVTVVIKTNQRNLQSLKASFERFDYSIKEIFGMLPAQDGLIDRYRLLMNYINM